MYLTLKGCTGSLGHLFFHQENMGVNEEQEEDALVERDAFRACFQWWPQLSKKRDFLPIMFLREFVQHRPLH